MLLGSVDEEGGTAKPAKSNSQNVALLRILTNANTAYIYIPQILRQNNIISVCPYALLPVFPSIVDISDV